ncbi:MAG: alcohol dehydrogenase catalytic domain-containing protein [Pseudomonadota bacterium]|nr:alcohol dehydrogenase catalytic domain-containing protein [Pseudomonadota bacterium]
MKAVQKVGSKVSVNQVDMPKVSSPNDVVVQIALTGLCRTDVYAARGQIDRVIDPLVLGHEFSGTVTDVGTDVSHVKVGDRVTCMPIIACGECPTCARGTPECCPHSTMLGIDHQGAFAEYVCVPGRSIFKLPDHVSFMMGAYMEPIAASYAVTKAGIQPSDKGIVFGSNRISELTLHILEACGFTDVGMKDSEEELEDNSLDFAVETLADDRTMEKLIRAVKPQGIIVIKSRKYPPVGVVFNDIVRKELKLIGTNYGSFEECIQMAADGKLKSVEKLWGPVHPLENFEEVFSSEEDKKQFLSAYGSDVWDR